MVLDMIFVAISLSVTEDSKALIDSTSLEDQNEHFKSHKLL